jgi:ubiquinone/menaquinone biosynthesis C-methylase UbiE
MTAAHTYALLLSDAERARYRLMAERASSEEAQLWQQAGIRPGARVADIGCGPGAMLPTLASAVGPRGAVVGVDADPDAVSAARSNLALCDLDDVDVRQAPADDTGLAAGSLDVVMMRHVLAHNGGREDEIVAHLATLLAPGGAAYLVDIDATAATLEPTDPDLLDLNDRYLRWHDSRGNDMRAGRHLADRVRRAGLQVEFEHRVTATMPLGGGVRPPAWAARAALQGADLATDQDVARWSAALQRIEASATRFVGSIPLYVVIGRKAGAR